MKLNVLSLAALALAACTSQSSEPARSSDPSLGRDVPRDAQAHPPRPVTKLPVDPNAPQLSRTVPYRQGDAQTTLWLSNELVAEIQPTNEGRDALLRSDPAGAEVAQGQRAVRVWRVRAVQGTDVFASNLSRGEQRFSPVLHETASPNSPILALPGGVVATFPSEWDRAHIESWLAARKLALGDEIGSGMNMFLVPTAPGLDALYTSNALNVTGELVSCEPNWWREAATR